MIENRTTRKLVQLLKNLSEWETPETNGVRKPSYAKFYADYSAFSSSIKLIKNPDLQRLDRAFVVVLENIRNTNIFESIGIGELDQQSHERAERLITVQYQNSKSYLLLVVESIVAKLSQPLSKLVTQVYICYSLLVQDKCKDFILYNIDKTHTIATDKLVSMSNDEFGDYNSLVDYIVDQIEQAPNDLKNLRKYNSSRISRGKFYSSLSDRIDNIEKTLEDLFVFAIQ